MNIKPIHDQLLVRRDPEDTVSAGGIIIPDVANNPKLPRGRGIVLAVGPGRVDRKTGKRRPMDTNIGDRVVFSKLSGDKVRDDLAVKDLDGDLVLISESEVMCVLEDD